MKYSLAFSLTFLAGILSFLTLAIMHPSFVVKTTYIDRLAEQKECEDKGGVLSFATGYSKEFMEKLKFDYYLTSTKPDQLTLTCTIPSKELNKIEIKF